MVTRNIRLVRSAPDPLGLYLRVGHNGQKEMQSFIASGDAAFSGVVFDARRVAKHKELLSQVLERRSGAGNLRAGASRCVVCAVSDDTCRQGSSPLEFCL